MDEGTVSVVEEVVSVVFALLSQLKRALGSGLGLPATDLQQTYVRRFMLLAFQ